jgi:hypothetical protein
VAKQCGTCTKCCDGTTSVGGDIFGHIYGNGKPCHFLNLTEKNADEVYEVIQNYIEYPDDENLKSRIFTQEINKDIINNFAKY